MQACKLRIGRDAHLFQFIPRPALLLKRKGKGGTPPGHAGSRITVEPGIGLAELVHRRGRPFGQPVQLRADGRKLQNIPPFFGHIGVCYRHFRVKPDNVKRGRKQPCPLVHDIQPGILDQVSDVFREQTTETHRGQRKKSQRGIDGYPRSLVAERAVLPMCL